MVVEVEVEHVRLFVLLQRVKVDQVVVVMDPLLPLRLVGRMALLILVVQPVGIPMGEIQTVILLVDRVLLLLLIQHHKED